MRFLLTVSVIFCATVYATVHAAPVEDKAEPAAATAVEPSVVVAESTVAETSAASVPLAATVEEQKEPAAPVAAVTTEAVEAPEEESEEDSVPPETPAAVETENVENTEKTEKKGRQLEDDDDDEGGEGGDHDEDEDDDEDEDEDEEEEEERKLKGAEAGTKAAQKKKAVPGKPVPVLGEGVEDDEAEDLGIYEREEPKSDEAPDTEKSSDEKSEEDKDDDDESAEEEERDDPIGGPAGLVAEPGSSERGDVEEVRVSSPVQNEVSGAEQPLAVAVVQPEESSDPVVPIIVEEPVIGGDKQTAVQEKAETAARNQKPKGKDEEEDDDDEDDEDDDDDDDDDDARSVKVHRHRARAAYNPSPVLYYYPFPEAPEPAAPAA